jgi:hypothetical protein
MDTSGVPFTIDAIAREAGVSRSWLYAQQDLRADIDRLRTRRRLEAAAERIRRLEEDNRHPRNALARTLGEQRAANILDRVRARDTPIKKTSKLIGPC